jgi:hypothetical protein
MTLDLYSVLWKKIITGVINPPIKSLPFKIKINFLRMQIKTHKVTEDEAARQLGQYCLQNEKMLELDLLAIKQLNTLVL